MDIEDYVPPSINDYTYGRPYYATCDTCRHGEAPKSGTGVFHCNRHSLDLAATSGCRNHLSKPCIINGQIIAQSETTITYQMTDGSIYRDGGTSDMPPGSERKLCCGEDGSQYYVYELAPIWYDPFTMMGNLVFEGMLTWPPKSRLPD